MTKRVARALLGEECSVRVMAAFRHHHGAIAVFLDQLVDAREEFFLIKFNFREQDHNRNAVVFDQATGRGNPACVTPHYLNHKHLGRGLRHRFHIKRSLQRGDRDVLGDRTKTRAAIGNRQVVVDRFRDVNRLQREAHRLGQLADFKAGVGRVAAAVIKEIADVVCLENLDQTLIFALVGFQRFELEAARTERARRRAAQRGNRRGGLFAGVNQVFGQRADDAITAGVNFADHIFMLARGFDHAAGRGVDYGGHATGLCVKGIFLCHEVNSPSI